MYIETVNPVTETILERYPLLPAEIMAGKIEQAHRSFQQWRMSSMADRKELCLFLASRLRQQKTVFATLIAEEMGKPLTQGEAEIEKCALACEFFAKEAQTLLSPRMVDIGMRKSMVCYEPLGVLFAIMPWNFPFWQVFRFAAPNIMAGNAVILKHAPISSGTGRAIESLFLEAKCPEHLFQSVVLDNDGAKQVIEHPRIAGVTLTGSESAGKQVAATAGANLKKVILELGGNDPYLVLEDADLSLAAKAIVTSRLNNCGQVCIAAKRVIAVSEIKDQLIRLIIEEMMQYKVGDPMDRSVHIGPMARRDLRDSIHAQVIDSIKQGAQLCLGGIMPQGKGFYYPPTLLTNVCPGMPAFDDELFGPVVCVIEAQNEQEAIQLANQSRFGLGAAVFTNDLNRGERIARWELEAGSCYVNAMVASHPYLPFGGIKCSGFGRELSHEGILEFVNVKTVSIQ